MADKSKIEWTDATWNPVTGCTKVSQGCKHCYAEREVESRWSKNPKSVWYGREFTNVRYHHERLEQPLRWRKPRRIFVNSMSDLFHPDVPDSFLDHVFAVMAHCPDHIFQVLTKRPDRMYHYLSKMYKRPEEIAAAGMNVWNKKYWVDGDSAWDYVETRISNGVLPNVWMGVSVEDQKTADERIPLLLQTPAAVRWISAEPLLGAIQLDSDWLVGEYFTHSDDCHDDLCVLNGDMHSCNGQVIKTPRLDWVVVGGESGPHARPMHPDWVRSLRDQCAAAGVPFMFKQHGEYAHSSNDIAALEEAITKQMNGSIKEVEYIRGDDGYGWIKVGKKRAGRTLDGELHDDYPEVN